MSWRGVAWRWVPFETADVGGGYRFIGDDEGRMKEEKDDYDSDVPMRERAPS